MIQGFSIWDAVKSQVKVKKMKYMWVISVIEYAMLKLETHVKYWKDKKVTLNNN